MRGSIIFKRAKTAYYSGKVRHTGDGEKRTYYEVEDLESRKKHIVTIEITPNGCCIDCDCTLQALHSDKKVLCSHIISVIYKIYHETKIK